MSRSNCVSRLRPPLCCWTMRISTRARLGPARTWFTWMVTRPASNCRRKLRRHERDAEALTVSDGELGIVVVAATCKDAASQPRRSRWHQSPELFLPHELERRAPSPFVAIHPYAPPG